MTTPNELINARIRADAKLSYARIVLQLLSERGGNGGSDFDRALQEAFLFHLLGAMEAFVGELNVYYGAGLPADGLSRGKLRTALQQRGVSSAELAELFQIESDPTSWLSHAKEMRDHSTHQAGVPRAYHMGGPNHGKVFLRNPSTQQHVEVHVTDALGQWLGDMESLLERLRKDALATNGLYPPIDRTALRRLCRLKAAAHVER